MPSVSFVAAHPDDEVFGAGPSVALHADNRELRFDIALADSFRRIHYVIVWPQSPPGQPLLGDIFEGL